MDSILVHPMKLISYTFLFLSCTCFKIVGKDSIKNSIENKYFLKVIVPMASWANVSVLSFSH